MNQKDNANMNGSKDKIVTDDDQISTRNQHIWVNDRHCPLYLRADLEYSLVKGKEIDQLIKEHHPHALKLRVLAK